jgi:hypothetical protein
LGIENFKFAIVTGGGAPCSSIGNVTGAAEQNGEGKILPEMRNYFHLNSPRTTAIREKA